MHVRAFPLNASPRSEGGRYVSLTTRTGDPTDWQPYITTTAEIAGGKPIVQGTRLTVEFVLGLFAAGWTSAQVLENYPTLSAETLRAVFAYSAEVLHDEALYSLRFDAA